MNTIEDLRINESDYMYDFDATLDEMSNIIDDFPEYGYFAKVGDCLRRAAKELREAVIVAQGCHMPLTAKRWGRLADDVDRLLGKEE